jgi:putative SOS response-associated peptidase YedK
MCGRFAQTTKPKNIAEKLQIQLKVGLEEFQPRYNVAPSSMVPCVRVPYGETKPVLENLKWGLIPSWAKDPKIGFKLANARAETVAELPSFRSAFKKQRCLVPIDGFYEWNQATQPKQPYYFSLKSEEPFYLAGLWEFWQPPTGRILQTFTLITTKPNTVVAPVCDRMPVILDEKDFEPWLNPQNQDTAQLQALLKPYPADLLKGYPVSTFMSKAGSEGSMCIEKISLPE